MKIIDLLETANVIESEDRGKVSYIVTGPHDEEVGKYNSIPKVWEAIRDYYGNNIVETVPEIKRMIKQTGESTLTHYNWTDVVSHVKVVLPTQYELTTNTGDDLGKYYSISKAINAAIEFGQNGVDAKLPDVKKSLKAYGSAQFKDNTFDVVYTLEVIDK